MKKLFFAMMAFVALFATSCQKEAVVEPTPAEEAMVSFNIGTPEIATRAYSDGASATVLQYAVYDSIGDILDGFTVSDGEIHGSTTVNLTLTTGNKYSVIFWAAAPGAPYAVDFENKEMTVDYSKAVCNDENRDAFYAYHTFEVKGTQTETIELRRPFAQLNIGTNDYTASTTAGYTPTQSSVVVKQVYSTLNLENGKVADPKEDVDFALAAIPAGETFPVSGYEYLAMNYLLVDAEQELVDIEFTYTDGANAKSRIVGSVPVQRNYRTNIYGSILTSSVDVNIEIKPGYNEPDNAASALQQIAAFGGEITLTEDVTLTSPLVIQTNVTINLAGYQIKGGKPDSPEATGTDIAAITIDNGATLTIEGNGVIEGTEYGVYAKNGNVIIKGGEIKANTSAVQVYRGIATIEGGEFSSTDKQYTINAIDAAWKSGEAKIIIRGGRFLQFNPANNAAEGANTNFVAEGFVSKADGDWFVVSEIIPEVYVDNAEEFENAINSGADKVIAKEDITIQSTLELNNRGSLTIDMNIFKLDGNGKYLINVLNNTQLVANGNFLNGFQVAYAGAHLTFNSGTINLTTSTALDPINCFFVAGGGVLEINDGEFSLNGSATRRYYIKAMPGSKVYVKGGTFGKASTRSGGYAAGIYGSEDEVIITGGTFGFNPTTWVADGYKAEYDSTAKTWTVVAE